MPSRRLLKFVAITLVAAASVRPARAADQPQWGQAWSRNMASPERGLPESFDPATGRNIKWIAELGSQSYASPIVARGRVLIGTNNDHPRDPRHHGDRAVLLCLDERDGHLLWQFVVPKISEDEGDKFLDWPKAGFASEPTVDGDRVYTLTNRGEVACLNLNGMADGNTGAYKDEAKHMAPRGQAPIAPGPTDADIIWLTDLVKEAGVHIHDQVHGSILVQGDLLYVNSCNGVDGTHRHIPCPDAPSLVVLDKRTGRIVAKDALHLGPTTFHCTWSSPSFGEVNGSPLIFFGGPDGVCYAFDALKAPPPPQMPVHLLNNVWKFDCDPTAPKEDIHRYVTNRKESPSVIMGMPVFDSGRIYLSVGGDLWWGKRQGWLKCIRADGKGDVTKSAEVWSYPLARETCCTPAVSNGLVFATDCAGTIHCVDAATGMPNWAYKANGDFWASTLVADGKVYAGTRKGQFIVLAAAKEEKLLSKVELSEPISGTATAANGVLYVSTGGHLYAIQNAATAAR